MKISSRHFFHRRALPVLPLTAAFAALLIPRAGAQTSTATSSAGAQVGPSAVTNSGNYLDVEGPGNTTFADFGVLDFSTSTLNPSARSASGIQNNQLTLQFTESNFSQTRPANLEFYLTTATNVSIAAGGALRYQTSTASSAPYGVDPALGTLGAASGSPALFDLGSGAFTSTSATGAQTDTYTLTLGNTAAQSAFLSELNSATPGSTVRLIAVVTSTPVGSATQANGVASFVGAGATTAANRPTLSFTPTFSLGNSLNWAGASGGSWAPTGTTNWSTTAGGTGTTGWVNDGTYTGIFGTTGGKTVNINAGNINAAGLEFDTTGYTINGTGAGNTLTLSSTGHIINVVNATDTATVNAPIAGTVGLIKNGAGTLVLGGTNTFSGGVNITAGTLQIITDSSLGDASNGINLGGGTLTTAGSLALGAGRTLDGSGTLAVATNNTLTFNGAVGSTAPGNLTLSGAGTVALASTAGLDNNGVPSNAVSTVTFGAAGGTLSSPGEALTNNGLGLLTLGGATVPTTVTGAATINANVNLASGTTNTFSVVNAGSTLTITGDTTGSGVLAKTGSGTLVLAGNGQAGFVAATGIVRQGTAGATPVDGGIIAVASVGAMPTGQYQANGGTLRNDSGATLILSNTISLGAQNAGTTVGGLVLADKNGTGAGITFTGAVSLYQGGATAYTRSITVNTPTTLSGGLTQTGTTGTGGLTFAGTSTLMLNATTPNTLNVPITIANTGTGGTTAATAGTFAATTSLTIATGSRLTINTGATGTVDTINDAALVTLNGTAGATGSFGKIALTLAGTTETVGGLSLGAADTFLHNGQMVTLQPGLAPAGTYGIIGSGADYQNNDYFAGAGLVQDAATAVPEPSTWLGVALGSLFLAAYLRRKQRASRLS